MADHTPARQDTTRTDWARGGCESPDSLPDLNGLTPDALTERFGPPTQRESFALGDRPDEFRIRLQNTYPLTDSGNATVEIQEWTWERDPCRLTVWFHRVDGAWQVLENLRWHRDAEF